MGKLREQMRWLQREVAVGACSGIGGALVTAGMSVEAATAAQVGFGVGVSTAVLAYFTRREAQECPVQVVEFEAGVHVADGGRHVELLRRQLVRAFGHRWAFPIGPFNWAAGQEDPVPVVLPLEPNSYSFTPVPIANELFQLVCSLTSPMRHRERRSVGFTATMRETTPVLRPFVALNPTAFQWARWATARLTLSWDGSSGFDPSQLIGRVYSSKAAFEAGDAPLRECPADTFTPSPNGLGGTWSFSPQGAEFYRLELIEAVVPAVRRPD